MLIKHVAPSAIKFGGICEKGTVKKRTKSDWVREKVSHRRAAYAIGRPSYRANPYHTPSLLGRHVIQIPSTLSIYGYSSRAALYKLLRQIAEIPPRCKLILDFSSLSVFKVAAVLILYAHLETMVEASGRTRLFWRKPKDGLIDKKLSDIGMWALLGENYNKVDGAVRIFSISHEQNQSNERQPLKDAIKYARDAISNYGKESPEEGEAAFEAISESFTNVWQHAYVEGLHYGRKTLDRFPRLSKWWIAQDHINGQLYMAVYDVGAGIPFTMRKNSWYKDLYGELLYKLIGSSPDEKDIQLALEYGSSRFKKQGRGNGFPAMKKFVEINPDGELCIMSGRALYKYKSLTSKETFDGVANSFPGTLIQWNVALRPNIGGGNEA